MDMRRNIRGKANVLAKYVDDLLLIIDKEHINEVEQSSTHFIRRLGSHMK